jgi:hypothetical protein
VLAFLSGLVIGAIAGSLATGVCLALWQFLAMERELSQRAKSGNQ